MPVQYEYVQYIQYVWDGPRYEVVDFYSYTPEEWFSMELFPNMQYALVEGREVKFKEFENWVKTGKQPEGAKIY